MTTLCILYAGGTIGMVPGKQGLEPRPGVMNAALAPLIPAGIDWELVEYAPLIDSSNAAPADWGRLAADLAARRERYDGFVVLHGTDTLAHTASALAFLLPGFGKPVAVTGSMRPLFEPGSDAPANVALAIAAASHERLAEVVVPFAGRVWRGCRVRKADSASDDAFVAPNDAPLYADGRWFPERLLAVDAAGFRPRATRLDRDVALLWLAPGATVTAAAQTLALPGLAGAVLVGYGAGNVPDRLAPALAQAAARGVVLASVTQAWRGGVAPGCYAASAALAAAGAVPCGDMTPEAALAKLTVLLSDLDDAGAVRAAMAAVACGERRAAA